MVVLSIHFTCELNPKADFQGRKVLLILTLLIFDLVSYKAKLSKCHDSRNECNYDDDDNDVVNDDDNQNERQRSRKKGRRRRRRRRREGFCNNAAVATHISAS